jgi:hypothetical protein
MPRKNSTELTNPTVQLHVIGITNLILRLIKIGVHIFSKNLAVA